MKAIFPALAAAAMLTAPLVPVSAAPAAPQPAPNPILANAKSFSVTVSDMEPNTQGKISVVGTAHFEFADGGKYREEMHSAKDKTMDGTLIVSNGTQLYLYVPSKAQYSKIPAMANVSSDMRQRVEAMPAGKPTQALMDGKAALLYQKFSSAGGKPKKLVKTWLDAKSMLPLREDTVDLSGKAPRVAERVLYLDWQINSALDDTQFAFTPPVGAKDVTAATLIGTPPAEPPLLANGTDAPDFAVQDKDGKPVHLADYKGKVVVLDFWATWCGPCQSSLPHTQSVAAQFAPQGVVVLAVNVWDKHDAFEQWLPQHAAFKDIAFAFDPSDGSKAVTDAYHVSGIPTQYVVGKDGKITQSFVGYDGPSDALSNAITSALKG